MEFKLINFDLGGALALEPTTKYFSITITNPTKVSIVNSVFKNVVYPTGQSIFRYIKD